MARSPLKDIEDTIIGDAALLSLERILRDEFSAITQGSLAGVIGFGKIGNSTAFSLKGREAVVSTYDINPSKNILAQVLGFNSRPLHQLLAQSQLIVGCTGQTSIRLADLPHIRNGAILASASSKRVEFAVDDFSRACEVTRLSDLVKQFKRRDNGSMFYLLNDGRPINFRDHSVLGTVLDLIYSELFVCMREVAEGRVPPGLADTQSGIHNEVSMSWLKEHGDGFTSDSEDKVWGYPETLKLGESR